ncbi:MAG: DUF4149 domain-containing protein [Verrucomicrobia bacterium]|nr:DUF4149 domain-containing protein [Verrucomicrobiota bacterium]
MIVFLRFVGVVNAGVWLGAALFLTLGAGPAFFSPEMKSLLGPRAFPVYSGAVAQIVIERYFVLQYWCAIIALAHLIAEGLYTGKALEKFTLTLLLGLFSLSLIGGYWLQPKLKRLHATKYQAATPELRDQAARSFRGWHGLARVADVVMMGGLLVYLWRSLNRPDAPRFVSTEKFRS